jgi:hypothetical protein
MGIGEPVGPGSHFRAEGFRLRSETEEPVGEVNGIGSTGSRCSRKAGGNDFHIVLGNAQWDGGREVDIGFECAIRAANFHRIAKFRMFVLEDLPDRAACLGTKIIRL